MATESQKKKIKQAKKTDAWVASQQQGEESWADCVRRLTALWPTPAAATNAPRKGAKPATGQRGAASPATTNRVKAVQAVRQAPVNAWVPVQPTASTLKGYFAADTQPTVVAPRARYPKGAVPAGLRQIGHDKRVQDWQMANFATEFKRVMIVGHSVWHARATARDAFYQHEEVQEVMFLGWVP